MAMNRDRLSTKTLWRPLLVSRGAGHKLQRAATLLMMTPQVLRTFLIIPRCNLHLHERNLVLDMRR